MPARPVRPPGSNALNEEIALRVRRAFDRLDPAANRGRPAQPAPGTSEARRESGRPAARERPEGSG